MDTSLAAYVQLTAMRKRLRNVQILFITLLVIASFMLFVSYAFSAFMYAIALAFYYFYLRPHLKEYGLRFAAERTRFGLCPSLAHYRDTPKGLWSEDDIASLKLLPIRRERQGLVCRHGFSGEVDQMQVQGSEVTFHYALHNTKGNPTYRFLSGMIVAVRRQQPGSGDWLLLQNDLVEEPALSEFLQDAGYVPVEDDLGILSDTCRLYSCDTDFAIGKALVKRINALLTVAPSTGAIRFTPQETIVFLSKRFFAYTIGTRIVITEEMLRSNPLPEFESILALAAYHD
ncbi:hypothetical protein [Oscillibacter sp.]|uniref:hypothetical protein n=1 Tax=Oscillibacter sp. TaxID=1945593 RepID=UPI0028A68CDE|nr:hypothetical protein [Oscillibacter sp.]